METKNVIAIGILVLIATLVVINNFGNSVAANKARRECGNEGMYLSSYIKQPGFLNSNIDYVYCFSCEQAGNLKSDNRTVCINAVVGWQVV